MRYSERLSQIRTPTLVLRGTEDRVVSAETIRRFVERIPGAELELIEGGGHCCQMTRPQATNQALRAWLARLTTAPSFHRESGSG